MSLKDWAVTEGGNNTTLGITLTEGATPFANLNNAARQIMADVRLEVASFGTAVAAAAAPDIGIDGQAHTVTGTTTISSFATASAGLLRVLYFETATPVAHSSTLALPGEANITSAKGDVASFRSHGSGNWVCESWTRKNGAPITLDRTTSSAGTIATWTSTEAGSTQGPDLILDRNSASPADNDLLGSIIMRGRDDGGNATDYVQILSQVTDVSDGTEDSSLYVYTYLGGAQAGVALEGGGFRALGFGYSNKGQGTANMAGLYVAGHGTVAQRVTDTETANTTLGTQLPYDDSIPQNTEGDEILSVAITPVNASSVLYIEAVVNIGGSSGLAGSIALFVDSTANALAAASTTFANSTDMSTITLRHSVSAASTSARTYKIRAGSSTTTDAFLNGHNSSRIFGGVAVSSLTVTEVLPQ